MHTKYTNIKNVTFSYISYVLYIPISVLFVAIFRYSLSFCYLQFLGLKIYSELKLTEMKMFFTRKNVSERESKQKRKIELEIFFEFVFWIWFYLLHNRKRQRKCEPAIRRALTQCSGHTLNCIFEILFVSKMIKWCFGRKMRSKRKMCSNDENAILGTREQRKPMFLFLISLQLRYSRFTILIPHHIF